MSNPALLVGLAGANFGWDLPDAKSPMKAVWGREFCHHETWNQSRACSGLSPHLTLHALAPRKGPGTGEPSCPN